MSCEKRRRIRKAFFKSQFSYYYNLIWMLHSRTLNNKINCLHERAVTIAHSVYKSSFNELLQKGNSFVHCLPMKFYKILNRLSPSIMNNIFKQNQNIPCELKNCKTFRSRRAKSVKYGTETISYLLPKNWSLVPDSIINSKSPELPKLKVRKWTPDCLNGVYVKSI